MRLLEEELREAYGKHILDLQGQVEVLEREVKKKAYLGSQEKTVISTVPRARGLMRANSTKSLERKKSANKKYNETLPE